MKKIKNPELKNLLENYRFTSANQIVVAMKEQGYTHKVRKGVHSFSREGERVSIRHKDLKKFADPKLESRHMEGIIERFNLYKRTSRRAWPTGKTAWKPRIFLS